MRVPGWLTGRCSILGGALLAAALVAPATAPAQAPGQPTTSSPIAVSSDDRYVWNVNPGTDEVTVIRASSSRVVRRIAVGDEPAAVALDSRNRYAYVASPGDNRLTVIQITDRRPRSFRTRVIRRVTTGAEPWNVVASPDGRRVFVANSAQDTITVLDRRGVVIGHVDLRDSRCNDPDRARQFQPRGLAVTRDSRRLFVTGFLAFTRPGGRQG